MATFEFRNAQEIEDAWERHIEKYGLPIAHLDDIVGSKQAANRQKDKESLPRLVSFREWLKNRPGDGRQESE